MIGGFFIFHHNQSQNVSSDRSHPETNSSTQPKDKAQKRDTSKNEADNSASGSTTTGSDDQKSSAGQVEENSSSSASNQSDNSKSDQPTSGNSSASENTTKNHEGTSNKGTSSNSNTDKTNQAVNRPNGAWVTTFEKELYKGYHVTPSHYKYIGNGNWEVWVKEVNTGEYPYVTVNQKTGDFHG